MYMYRDIILEKFEKCNMKKARRKKNLSKIGKTVVGKVVSFLIDLLCVLDILFPELEESYP